jgi:DNA-binding CsgD family transcriptional regulator
VTDDGDRADRNLDAMRKGGDWHLRLIDRMATTIPRRDGTKLTPVELESVAAASFGLSEDEIGVVLGRPSETVKSQLMSARRVLAAKNTTHLVALALRQGLIV